MPVQGWVPTETRAAVLVSACEVCGSESQLGLHHLDEDRTNNSPSNLQTLCAACHTRLHWESGKQPWRRHSPTCVVCGKPAKRLGLCETHRSRLLRHGSPYLKKMRRGSSWLWVVVDGPLSGLEFRALPLPSQTGWTDCGASAMPSSRRSHSGSANAS